MNVGPIIPVSGIEETKKSLQTLGDAAISTTKKVKEIGDVAVSASKFMQEFGTKITKVSGGLQKAGIDLGGLTDAFKNFFTAGTAGASNLTKAMGTVLSTISSQLVRNLIDPTKDASESISSLSQGAGVLNTSLKKLLQTEDIARTAFYTTSGGVKTYAERMKEANDVARDYPASLHRSAVATGFFTSELIQIDKAVKGVPGAFKEARVSASDYGGVLAGVMLTPTRASTVALRGLGFQASEIGPKINALYKDFDQTGKEAVSSLSTMESARLITGVNAKLAFEQISSASKAFAIFGGKADAAAQTWTNFNVALKNTVPVNEINKLVGDVTRGIATMSLEHRAFIAQISGATPGSSMLGGGLKMEMALRSPDGMGKNMDALTKTLSQFAGGKIITLKQAVEMPELETQFVLQRKLLGQLSGVQGNEQQNRLLEVLQQTQAGGMSRVTASKEMGNLMKSGSSLQKQNITGMEKLTQAMRLSTHAINNWMHRFNDPISKEVGAMGMRAARSTKGRSMPLPGTLNVQGTVQRAAEQMAGENRNWEIPGGTPMAAEFGFRRPDQRKVPTMPKPYAGPTSPAKTAKRYMPGERPAGRIAKRYMPGERPAGRIYTPRNVTARPRAAIGIRAATSVMGELKTALNNNTAQIKEEMTTPIKIELATSCPECNKTKIDEAIGQRTGTYKKG